jgi:hypothetical protein
MEWDLPKPSKRRERAGAESQKLRIGPAPVNVQARGPYRGSCSVVVVMMVMMMVLRRGQRRCGNHHNEQGGKQDFLHGSNRSIASIAPAYYLW